MNKSTKNIKHFDSRYPGSSLDPISMIQHIHSEKYHYIQHACGFGKSKLMNFRFARDPSKFNKHKTLVNTLARMVKVFLSSGPHDSYSPSMNTFEMPKIYIQLKHAHPALGNM